ncbi:hypothetical protein OAF85_00150 [Planctomycetota bacterium]|nr:hypothetical protein [Planctomycetota bacterium]
MDDLAGAVDAALDEEEDAVAGDGAVALVGPGVDDEVGGSGLVLERMKMIPWAVAGR